ncbi:MAG: WGR domain-containing protein [Myxococcota bacterium]|nr:WGR domain-containing protein [Myxococcota bacterium]
MIRLEMTEGTSSKFWEIELSGKVFTARWGRIGTTGQEKQQSWPSPAIAQQEHDKLVAAKRKKGYADAGGKRQGAKAAAPVVAHPRNPQLEAALRKSREDAGAAQVYADWLQGQGSALGELIILEQALAKRKDPAKQRRATAIKKTLGLPAKDLAVIGWRAGMWQSIHLQNDKDWNDGTFDALALARPLFTSPLCASLAELRIGILRWEHNAKDVPAVLAEAGRQDWAADLETLFLGDIGDNIDMSHHCVGDVGKVITKAFPRLTSLKIHSGDQSWAGKGETFGIGPLALPELTSLVIETCSLSKKRLKHVLEATLPKLTTLELWFGSEDQDATATFKDLRPLLDGVVHPKVVHLGLRNAEFTDDLARGLPASKIAARLVSLDLSMGTLSDDGAAALAERVKAFPKLKTLSIDDNFLSRATVRAVQAAFKGVTVVSKRQKTADESDVDDDDEDGEPFRYVSVSE